MHSAIACIHVYRTICHHSQNRLFQIRIEFPGKDLCVFIRHGLFIRNTKSSSWKLCGFRRFPFRLNINCDFIYSWQEDSCRPRTRGMAFACKCIDELLISVLFDFYLLLCEFFWTDRCKPGYEIMEIQELTTIRTILFNNLYRMCNFFS